jgi:hypothetical protein
MRRGGLMMLAGCVVVVVLFALAGAQEAPKVKHEYVGVKVCAMCHKTDGIHESWLATKHATAWDKLSPEDQKKEALKPFYTTGTTAKGDLLTGVQCEACHGPGSDYKAKSVMQDKQKAIEAGMLIPDAKTCLKCHNDKAPTAALVATVKAFDYAKMKVAGAHAPAKKAEPAKQ